MSRLIYKFTCMSVTSPFILGPSCLEHHQSVKQIGFRSASIKTVCKGYQQKRQLTTSSQRVKEYVMQDNMHSTTTLIKIERKIRKLQIFV